MVEVIESNDLIKNRLYEIRDDLLRFLRKLGINDEVTYEFIREDFVGDSNNYERLVFNLQLIFASVLTNIGQNSYQNTI